MSGSLQALHTQNGVVDFYIMKYLHIQNSIFYFDICKTLSINSEE